MPSQQYSPLSLFMVLGLLAFAPPETIDRHLASLGFALDATSKSVDNLKKGIDTFHTGLQQFSQPDTGATNGQENGFSPKTNKEYGTSTSIMPVDAPGWNHNDQKEETEETEPNPVIDLNDKDPGIKNSASDLSATNSEEGNDEE